MNIGQIKQAIRQRCRLDPVLTSNYIYNYVLQFLGEFSSHKVFKRQADITMIASTYEYALPRYIDDIDKIEYGSTDDFTNGAQILLLKNHDFEITRNTTDSTTNNVQDPYLKFKFLPAADYRARVHYNAYLDTFLSALWADDSETLDTVIPANATMSLIIYVSLEHKKNWQKDSLTAAEKEEHENAKWDIIQLMNERVEYVTDV